MYDSISPVENSISASRVEFLKTRRLGISDRRRELFSVLKTNVDRTFSHLNATDGEKVGAAILRESL